MSDDALLEGLLRPPVEYLSAAAAASAAVLTSLAPAALMMTPTVGYGSAAVLAVFAVWRYRQGVRVRRYQRNLRRLQSYTLRAVDTPRSKYKLFIGRGFEWSAIHTQRLTDVLDSRNRKYVSDSAGYKWARKVETEWERTTLAPVARLLQKNAWWNPWPPLPPLGGLPAIHGIELKDDEVWLGQDERAGHTIVYGTTRCGKSRLAEVLVTQDIARGDGPVVLIDPKGDAGLMLRLYIEANRYGRADNFYVFHLGFPDLSARYNAVGSFARISEVATRATGPLAAEGDGAAFKEFAWRFVNMVTQALVKLGEKPTYERIAENIIDMEPIFIRYAEHYLAERAAPNWLSQVSAIEREMKAPPRHMQSRSKRCAALEQYLTRNKIYDKTVLGLLSAIRYDSTYFSKLTASFLPLMEKLTSGRISELVSPVANLDDHRPEISWTKIIRSRAVVYIGLDAMTDTDVAQAVGNAMFADLVSTAGYLYKFGTEHGIEGGRANVLPTIYLHADEFSDLAGDEFRPLLNKSGGAGIRVTAYTQTKADVANAMGSEMKAAVLEGNFNNVIMLRVKSQETAEILTTQLPEVYINAVTAVSGATDGGTDSSTFKFSSKNEDRVGRERVPMISPSMIINLPKGQAFALVEGSRLYKLRFPQLKEDPSDTAGLPQNVRQMSEMMRQRYATGDAWVNHSQTMHRYDTGLLAEQPQPNVFADAALVADAPERLVEEA